MSKKINHPLAPRELFEQMLEYMPIATFDLIIEYGEQKVIVVKRKIAPYKNVWALPGLRMYKGERIDDALKRIALQEVGLEIDPAKKRLLSQYVGKFFSENDRQDISTCYVVSVGADQRIVLNADHFSKYAIINQIPKPIGAMYKYYLQTFFSN